MNVCHLLPSLAPGGAERMSLRLVENSSSDVSYSICYFGSDYEDAHYLRGDFESAGATVHHCGSGFIYRPRGLLSLLSFLRTNDVDVLHNHLIQVHPMGRVIGRLGGIDAVVSTHHGVLEKYNSALQSVEEYTRWLDDVTVAYADGVTEEFTDQWEVVYNGINVAEYRDRIESAAGADIRTQLGVGKDEHLFLNVSRYVRQKSQMTAVKAMSQLRDRRSDIHLALVGHGPEEDRLREKATELGVDDRVNVTGQVPAVEPYYAAADAFVLTYAPYINDWGIVALEAMTGSLPIVATATEHMSQVVKEGITGFQVPPQEPGELADAIDRISTDVRLERFGDAGFELVIKNFDINDTVEQYESIYRRVSG